MQPKLCFFLILLLHCTASATRSHRSLEARFFDFASAPVPDGHPPNPFIPVPVPVPEPATVPSTPTSKPSPPASDPPSPSITPPPPSQISGSSGGLTGGQKAGIAIGSIAGAGLLVFGGMIYKTRRSNIRRARFASAARTPML